MWHRHLFFFAGHCKCSARHLLWHRDALPLSKQKDRIDCVWVVNVIGGDTRCIGSAARLCEKHLVKEPSLLDVAGEHLSLVDVLIADRRGQILPARAFRIQRRAGWGWGAWG